MGVTGYRNSRSSTKRAARADVADAGVSQASAIAGRRKRTTERLPKFTPSSTQAVLAAVTLAPVLRARPASLAVRSGGLSRTLKIRLPDGDLAPCSVNGLSAL